MKLKKQPEIYLGENFDWNGIPEEEYQEDLTEDSPSVLTIRKRYYELVNNNPNLTIDDVEKLMIDNNMDDQLMLFVLGTEKIETLRISTTTKLIEYMQEQNPNLTREDIIRKMNDVNALK